MHADLKNVLRWMFATSSDIPCKIPFVAFEKVAKEIRKKETELRILKCISTTKITEIDAFLQETNTTNYYWGTCLVGQTTGKMGRHKEKDVLIVPTLWTEIDNINPIELEERLGKSELPQPSLIIKTGRGFHIYWKLSTPITPDRNGFSFSKTKEVLKEITRRMGGEGADFARVLRVPTTRYIKLDKDMKEPRYIEIHRWEPRTQYTWQDFEKLQKPVVEHKQKERQQNKNIPHQFKRDHPIEMIPALYDLISSGKNDGDTHRYYCPKCQGDNEGRGSLLIYVNDQKWHCGHRDHDPANTSGDAIALVQLITGKTFKEVIKVDIGGPEIRDEIKKIIENKKEVKPQIKGPGLGRPLSMFAEELADYVKNTNFFVMNNELIYHSYNKEADQTTCIPVNGCMFRTLIEKYVTIITTCENENGVKYNIAKSLRGEESSAIVSSEQFKNGLRHISRINHCRMPTLRKNNKIELLPEGYDQESKIMTISTVTFREDMNIYESREIIDTLLGEFSFDQRFQPDRSKSVTIAAMLTLFASTLLPKNSLRPAFIVESNAEGGGKSTIIQAITVPVLGHASAITFPSTTEEMQKTLISSLRAAKQAICFDNVKGKINCSALEGFISAPFYEGRLLGGNINFSAPNNATIFISVNNAHMTADMERRSLIINLRMTKHKASEKNYKNLLDYQTLTKTRPVILAALWAFVKRWDSEGRRPAKTTNNAFPSWAKTIAGIVVANGYTEPSVPCVRDISGETDGDDMMRLKEYIVETDQKPFNYNFTEFCQKCREVGSFEYILGTSDVYMTNKDKSALGWILKRFQEREVGGLIFKMKGYGPRKEYCFEEE